MQPPASGERFWGGREKSERWEFSTRFLCAYSSSACIFAPGVPSGAYFGAIAEREYPRFDPRQGGFYCLSQPGAVQRHPNGLRRGVAV